MMKKFAFLIAVAAMGFTACSKDEGAEVNNESSFKLTIEASADDTRSSFGDKDENGYISNWSGTENVWFYMGEGTTGVKATPAAAGPLTTFDVTFTGTAPESGVIYALSPVGDYNGTPKKGGFTSSSLSSDYSYAVISAEQTPLAASCDESVHLLAATKEFTGSIESPLKMQFNHVAAYGKMAITNFTPAIASVTITSPVAIVGNSCKYFYKTGALNAADGKTLTLDAANVENNTFWFGCAPAELTSGVMTVAVTDTEGKRYVKDITLTADKGIKFIQGRVAAFKVNMAGIEPEETPSQLIPDGDYVIAAESEKVMMTVGTPSTKYRGHDTLPTSFVDGKLAVDEDAVWTINYDAAKGGYTIKSYSEGTYIKYNGSTGAANLDSSAYIVNINAVDGGYNITASSNLLAYNSSSPRFAFYASNFSSGIKVLQIIPAYVDKTPAIAVDTKELNIPATGTDGMNITVTTKNFGDYTVSASSDNDLFTTSVSGDTVTVTAAANETDTAIEGTITITVTDGENTLTETVTIEQAAAGQSVPKYVKVTSAPADWSGHYLIIQESSKLIFDGSLSNLDAANNCPSITINNDSTIDASEINKAKEFIISVYNTGYSIQSASGYYIGRSANSNGIDQSQTTQYVNKISFNTNGTVNIIGSGGRKLNYNSSSKKFRYFASGNTTEISLYKLTD